RGPGGGHARARGHEGALRRHRRPGEPGVDRVLAAGRRRPGGNGAPERPRAAGFLPRPRSQGAVRAEVEGQEAGEEVMGKRTPEQVWRTAVKESIEEERD